MQKFIKITAIVAAVLMGLSFLLLIVSIPMQQLIAGKWMNWPDVTVAVLPMFPLPQFVNCFLMLGCGILMIVCAGNKKGGIWLEILVLAAIAVVLPLLNTLLTGLFNVWVGHVRGESYMAAISIVNTISSYCMLTGSLGRCLVLVTCGMSIVFKRMSKKLEKIVE